MNDDDLEWNILLEKVNSGDPLATNSFIINSQKKLYKFCLFYTGNEDIAKDVLQDTYLKVFANKIKFDTDKDPLPFLKTIARNIYLDLIKKASNSKIHIGQTHANESLFGSTNTIEERETLLDIVNFLLTLDEEDRALLILVEIEGHTYKEASQILGITENSLRMKIHRVKKSLITKNSETTQGPQSYIKRGSL